MVGSGWGFRWKWNSSGVPGRGVEHATRHFFKRDERTKDKITNAFEDATREGKRGLFFSHKKNNTLTGSGRTKKVESAHVAFHFQGFPRAGLFHAYLTFPGFKF
ncbi:MAG: hypothetical protein D6714_04710 [Bacteroidetes bacterium]|nr:MAG: hypothetical protein D6714_04710 [Bacteroidota bacterium]